MRISLVALLALSCSAPPPTAETALALPAPTAEQQAALALTRAAATWTRAIGWAPAVAALRLDEPTDDADRAAGMWNADAATLVLVPERIGPEQARWDTIALHELGHAIGLGHNPRWPSLMAEVPAPPACVWAADVLELEAELGIVGRMACAETD